MNHITFSIISAFLGLNTLLFSAQTESKSVPQFKYGFSNLMSQTVEKERDEVPFFLLPKHTVSPTQSQIDQVYDTVTKSQKNTETKVEAYNTKSGKEIGSVSVKAIERSNAIIACSNPDAQCTSITTLPTVTPTTTITPSPTASIKPVISVPPCKDPVYPVENASPNTKSLPGIIQPCPLL